MFWIVGLELLDLVYVLDCGLELLDSICFGLFGFSICFGLLD